MMPSRKKTESAKKIRKWMDFFLFANNESRNQEVLSEYFFSEFSQDPKAFYSFLSVIAKKIRARKTAWKEKTHIAEKYLSILLPLSERFGLFAERDTLNDLCLRVTEPKKYKSISKKLSRYKQRSKKIISQITNILQKTVTEKKYKCTVQGRYKSIYSIYQKMQKKGKSDIFQLQDIFAFRMILQKSSEAECFEVLNILHDAFTPLPRRFKDYISIPKINGYQSLHTGLTNVISDLDLPIEVQIRTDTMDEFAERGFAAHWLYSQEKKAKVLTEKEKLLFQHLSFAAHMLQKEEYVYCFSHKGDLFQLEKDAVLLDFAYHIHTELGNQMQKGLVNGSEREANYHIHEGDKIKIIRAPKKQVQKKWLQYTTHKNTRKKILSSLS